MIIPTAEPFFFPGQPGQPGCLLIHGFTGTPKEMRWMGEYLHAQGYSCLGVRLAGHATRPEDMIHSRYTDWMASVEDGYHLLCGATNRVYLMGLSMGGVLALLMSTRLDVAGVVAMDTLYRIPYSYPVWMIKLISKFMPYQRKSNEAPGASWFDKDAYAAQISYPQNPVRSAAELKLLASGDARGFAAGRCAGAADPFQGRYLRSTGKHGANLCRPRRVRQDQTVYHGIRPRGHARCGQGAGVRGGCRVHPPGRGCGVNPSLVLVSVSLFTWGIGEGMFLYFVPLYLQQLGAQPVVIGTVYSAFGFFMLLAHIPAGYLSDRLGRRPLIRAAWILGLIATWVMALGPSLEIFVAGFRAVRCDRVSSLRPCSAT